jgi:hypothetical protein
MSNIRKTFGNKSFSVASRGAGEVIVSSQLCIIGGNFVDDIPCIVASVPTSGAFILSAELPSADSADTLPNGIGRAWLFNYSIPIDNANDGLQSPDGGITGRVYVINWNNEIGNYPLMAGSQIPTYSTKKLTYVDGETTYNYTAYIPSWR